MKDYNKIFSEKIKELRVKNKKVTQKEFADQIGIQVGTYAGYESTGNFPTVNKLLEIADYFGVSLDYFFNRETIVPEKSNNPVTAEDISNVKELLDNVRIDEPISNSTIKEVFERFQQESQKELEQILKSMSVADIIKIMIALKE